METIIAYFFLVNCGTGKFVVIGSRRCQELHQAVFVIRSENQLHHYKCNEMFPQVHHFRRPATISRFHKLPQIFYYRFNQDRQHLDMDFHRGGSCWCGSEIAAKLVLGCKLLHVNPAHVGDEGIVRIGKVYKGVLLRN